MSGPGSYEVRIKASAEREMDSLPRLAFRRVTSAILGLESNPRPRGCKRLAARHEYRVRVGDYRILYLVDDARRVVQIVAIGHRRDVYRFGG